MPDTRFNHPRSRAVGVLTTVILALAVMALALPGVTLMDWSTGMIFAGWPILTAFILLYGIRSPWRATIASRALMILVVALWMIYAVAGANSVYGQDWPFRGAVRAVVYTLTTGSFAYLLWTLINLQRLDRLPKVVPPEDTRGLAREEQEDD